MKGKEIERGEGKGKEIERREGKGKEIERGEGKIGRGEGRERRGRGGKGRERGVLQICVKLNRSTYRQEFLQKVPQKFHEADQKSSACKE